MDLALPVLGGLGLFLYGMNMMGTGLEKAAGNRLKRMIEALTANRFKAILVGTFVTMLIQSSGATTVMVVGFVNAGIMTLPQAIGVIMGANIGTTITAQLIAFKLTDYAPLAVAIGVAIWIAAKNKKAKTYAEILIGVGILFMGMDMMGSGLNDLADLKAFATLMQSLNHPILGMLAGLIITTIVMSSSASVGLLQALAGQGFVNMSMAFPILFGENIGATSVTLISSIGANKTAKRAAIIHLLMKIIGTVIFMTVLRYPVEAFVVKLTPGDAVRQIANAHTAFNIVNSLILYPFISWIVKAAEILVPGEDKDDMTESKYLDKRILETPSIALGQAGRETIRMGQLVLENLSACKTVMLEDKIDGVDAIFARERSINKIQREITDYLVLLSNAALTEEQHTDVNAMLYVIGDIERVGDHVENITELAQFKYDNSLYFTPQAIEELNEMFNVCDDVFRSSVEAYRTTDEGLARRVLELEDEVDRLEKQNRANHIDRLNKMLCSTGSGIVFLDVISNLERVSDHASNIAMYVLDKIKY
ncbi:MAG: Na/Pi cotransporter family protein [Gudongella sp.]|jgi:phosphate:Na+ symporter|nr:Na/Pi cotransporter family protein [Gudongella sp.]